MASFEDAQAEGVACSGMPTFWETVVAMDVKLVMFRQDGSRRKISLPSGTTTIGRKNTCDIRIPLAEVSRLHSEILLSEEGVLLTDLQSANGTFVNNRRVKNAQPLQAGDQILVGPVVFTVQIGGIPEDSEMVEIRTRTSHAKTATGPAVGTSKHVYISDEEIDPIAALEALASSADQTAINADEDDE